MLTCPLARGAESRRAPGLRRQVARVVQVGAFVSRDELAKQDEDNNILEFRLIWNDGQPQNFIWLISTWGSSLARMCDVCMRVSSRVARNRVGVGVGVVCARQR